MKQLLTFAFILFTSIQIAAQTSSKPPSFQLQFKKLLSAVEQNFTTYKGEKVKANGADVIYNSTTILTGTTDNQVVEFENGSSYMAKLGEALNEKEAKQLIENWKKKVVTLAGDAYEATKDNVANDEYKRIAYLLMGENCSISIHALQYTGEKDYSAFLLVMKL